MAPRVSTPRSLLGVIEVLVIGLGSDSALHLASVTASLSHASANAPPPHAATHSVQGSPPRQQDRGMTLAERCETSDPSVGDSYRSRRGSPHVRAVSNSRFKSDSSISPRRDTPTPPILYVGALSLEELDLGVVALGVAIGLSCERESSCERNKGQGAMEVVGEKVRMVMLAGGGKGSVMELRENGRTFGSCLQV